MNKNSSKYKRIMQIRSKNSLREFGYDYRKWGLITTIYGTTDLKQFIKHHMVLKGCSK